MRPLSVMRARGAAGGGGTYPTLTDFTMVGKSATNWSVAFPATVPAGALIILWVSRTSNTTVTTPSGFTALNSLNAGSGSSRLDAFYKIASGSEGGTNLTVTHSGSTLGIATIHIIGAGTFTGVPEAVGSNFSVNSSQPDPLTITPSWGAVATRYITLVAHGYVTTVSAYPSGYGLAQGSGGAGTGFVSFVATASANKAVASENPGVYVLGTGTAHCVQTIAVRGT